MPTYSYTCKDCKENWNVFHGMDEKEEKCAFCSSSEIYKSFRSLESRIRPERILYPQEKEQIRNRVEKHIEEARQSLKEQLAEARKEYK